MIAIKFTRQSKKTNKVCLIPAANLAKTRGRVRTANSNFSIMF